MALKPVILCILDGWGLREETEANAPALANTPNFDRIWASEPRARLSASGEDVGLPAGQMGNSEVGHTNIGAGRVVVELLQEEVFSQTVCEDGGDWSARAIA